MLKKELEKKVIKLEKENYFLSDINSKLEEYIRDLKCQYNFKTDKLNECTEHYENLLKNILNAKLKEIRE